MSARTRTQFLTAAISGVFTVAGELFGKSGHVAAGYALVGAGALLALLLCLSLFSE